MVQSHNLILELHYQKIKKVLALLMFYVTIKNTKKSFKVLSCVIYTIINNHVCIDYLACEQKELSEPPVGSEGGLNMETEFLTKYWEL